MIREVITRLVLVGKKMTNPWRYFDGVRPVLRGHALAVGGLVLLSVLSSAKGCYAQQTKSSQAGASTVPILEALPHNPLPQGDFKGWCGRNDKILMNVDRGVEIYDKGVKASPLSFPRGATLRCGDDGQKLVFVDEDAGLASEVDIAGGIVTRTLATFEKTVPREISFSPGLTKVVSNQPLTSGSAAADLKIMPLSGSKAQAIADARWSGDSSEFFVTSLPKERVHSGIVDIFDTQLQKIGSGALPAGLSFRDGWFANSQALYFYMGLAHDEFGTGIILRCRIENWKCDQVANNVLDASVGGGVLGMVRAVGKYSNDGDWETIPLQCLVEIRNGNQRMIARQTFKSVDRYHVHMALSPSGTKAILTWSGKVTPGCLPGKQGSDTCHSGMVIDLSGRPK